MPILWSSSLQVGDKWVELNHLTGIRIVTVKTHEVEKAWNRDIKLWKK